MQPRRHEDAPAPSRDGGRPGVRRVAVHTLIAAPRARVWTRVSAWRGLPLRGACAAAATQASPPPNAGGVLWRVRGLGLVALREVAICTPPERYGYSLTLRPLFRTFAGIIELRELHPTTTTLTWTIEFRPAVPGTGRIVSAVLDQLVANTLFHLKRDLETAGLVL